MAEAMRLLDNAEEYAKLLRPSKEELEKSQKMAATDEPKADKKPKTDKKKNKK